MNPSFIRIFSLLIILFCLNVSAQESSQSGINTIISATDSLHSKLPVEKVYLHTDKDSYNIGDTIWFKAYVLDAVYLSGSEKSNLLFVELHDDHNEMIRRISVQIFAGVGYAQIVLTNKIFKEGGYTLRAYTNWMANFGVDYTFAKRLYVGLAHKDSWLVNSDIKIKKDGSKDVLQMDLSLMDINKIPIGLRRVQMKLLEGDVTEGDVTLYDKILETPLNGKIAIDYNLKKKIDLGNVMLEISDLRKGSRNLPLRIPISINRSVMIDLQFLPEGGSLVAGLKSTVGFKAIAENGRGVDVEGKIYDMAGNVVGAFKSLHKGIGSFEFIPKAGEKYTAKLSKPGLRIEAYDLPEIRLSGTVMHIENLEEGDSIRLSIDATKDIIESQSILYLIGASRGIVCYAQTIDLKSSKMAIAKSLFPTGIARFSILKGVNPLNERIVFIDHKDELDIKITADKPNYSTRDSIAVNLAIKDKTGKPVRGSFSLAVTDNSQVKPDTLGNHSISTSLLLNSNLKGTVEDPGFYLKRSGGLAWKALDNLMLTQGWTGFDWKIVFATIEPPKYDGMVTEKKKVKFNVGYMSFPYVKPVIFTPWFLNGDQTQLDYAKNAISKFNDDLNPIGNVLKEVKITSKKKAADIVLDTGDIAQSGAIGLYQLLKQMVPNLQIEFDNRDQRKRGYGLKIGNRQVVFRFGTSNFWKFKYDSPQILKDSLNSLFNISAIKSVEIMYTDQYVARHIIPTVPKQFVPGERAKNFDAWGRAGLPPPDEAPPAEQAIVDISFLGPRPSNNNPFFVISPQEFYSPKYKIQSNSGLPDTRSTIYWEPNIITNEKGEANVSFYAADIPGGYTISIEGSDLQGAIGSFKSSVKIEK